MHIKFLTVILLILGFGFGLPVRSQEQANQIVYTQGLKRKLAAAADNVEKDTILQNLVNAYLYYKPDSALFYTEQRIQLAQRINAPKIEAQATGYYGYLLGRMANYPLAVKYLLDGLGMAKAAKDTAHLDFFYDALSNTFIEQGNYEFALSYANQFQDISVREKDTLQMGWLITKGVIYEKLGYLDSAIFFLQKAFDYDMLRSGDITRERYLLSLGNIYLKKDSLAEASWLYQMAIDKASQKKNYINLIDAFNGIAQLYGRTGSLDSGIYYAGEALRRSDVAFYLAGQLAANSNLADLYKKKGDKDKALNYLQATIALKDSLFNQQKERAVQNLLFNEKIKDRDIKERERQIRNKWRLFVLTAGVLALLVLALILYRNNRNKQRAYALLQKQKVETDEAKARAEQALDDLKAAQMQLIQREKMASLGELTAGIAHEIQNPLNFVTNFSEVNAELINELREEVNATSLTEEEKKTVINVIDDIVQNQQRVNHHGKRAEAIVKSMLQHSLPANGEKQPTDINLLVEECLRLSYHGFSAKDKTFDTVLNTHFDPTIGTVPIVSQEIGKVLLNLFNNAFYYVSEKKHRLNGVYTPAITVSTKRINRKIEIVVRDNGIGIPEKFLDKIYEPFFTTKPTGIGTGLGLYLSYDIVTKGHGGEIKVKTKEGEYTEFTITLPA